MTTASSRVPRALGALLLLLVISSNPPIVQAGDVFPELILEHLSAAGLPLRDVVIFDEWTDPNALLGRPGQYFAKASWTDRRGDREAPGTLELFRTPEDFERRRAYLSAFVEIPLFAEHMYARWPVILRVDHRLTPLEASAYDYQLAEILKYAASTP